MNKLLLLMLLTTIACAPLSIPIEKPTADLSISSIGMTHQAMIERYGDPDYTWIGEPDAYSCIHRAFYVYEKLNKSVEVYDGIIVDVERDIK